MHFYSVLFNKSFMIHFQYRLSHMLNNAGSLIFGFIYIAIWQGTLGSQREVIGFSGQEMGYYIAFTQGLLWITTFLPRGLGIQEGMRTGAVSIELMRPMNFFSFHLFQALGNQSYNLLFRSVPIFIVFIFLVGARMPSIHIIPLLLLSILLSAYIGFLFHYFVGLAAFWSTDNRWAFMINFTFVMTLSGNFVPLPLLPEPLATISQYLPFAALHYYPTLTYLGRMTVLNWFIPIIWAIALTILALLLTKVSRRKMEIQGG